MHTKMPVIENWEHFAILVVHYKRQYSRGPLANAQKMSLETKKNGQTRTAFRRISGRRLAEPLLMRPSKIHSKPGYR